MKKGLVCVQPLNDCSIAVLREAAEPPPSFLGPVVLRHLLAELLLGTGRDERPIPSLGPPEALGLLEPIPQLQEVLERSSLSRIAPEVFSDCYHFFHLPTKTI
jgi:hypothetical protein